jgi:hypothetical protein
LSDVIFNSFFCSSNLFSNSFNDFSISPNFLEQLFLSSVLKPPWTQITHQYHLMGYNHALIWILVSNFISFSFCFRKFFQNFHLKYKGIWGGSNINRDSVHKAWLWEKVLN